MLGYDDWSVKSAFLRTNCVIVPICSEFRRDIKEAVPERGGLLMYGKD